MQDEARGRKRKELSRVQRNPDKPCGSATHHVFCSSSTEYASCIFVTSSVGFESPRNHDNSPRELIRVLRGTSPWFRRATSSHLHVVPAGNSQRNSLAVSECQEELNNAIFPFSRRAVAPKTESPNLTKHQTSQNQYREEVVPPHAYAPTTENGTCHSICPARQRFTA